MSGHDDGHDDGHEGAPLGKVEKAAIGCFGCAVIVPSAIGAVLGAGGGALYHALLAPDGGLSGPVGVGALIGLLAGARLFVPLEEVAADIVFDVLPGLFSWGDRGSERGPRAS